MFTKPIGQVFTNLVPYKLSNMDIRDTRRANLRAWAKQHGTPAKERSYFSQVISGTAPIGERAARRLERDYRMGDGYLDQPGAEATDTPVPSEPMPLAWPFPAIPRERVEVLTKDPVKLERLQGALAFALAQVEQGLNVAPKQQPKAGGTVNLDDAHDPFPMAPREQMPWDPGWKPTKAADLPRPVLRGGVVANVSPGSTPPANDRFEKVAELGEVRLAAGEGIENDHEQETGYIQFRRSFLRAVGADGGRARVVYAKGDSMLPVIQDGAALLVVPDESLTLRDLGAGGVFAINYDGKMIVKSIVMDPRSGRWMARSFNELHPDIPLDDDSKVKVLGRVVWVGAKLPEGDAGQWVRR